MSYRLDSPAAGRALTAAGVVILSPDALLTRLVDADDWTVIWWRAVFTAAAIAAALAVLHRREFRGILRRARPGPAAAVSLLWAIGTILFVLAVRNTATANVLVIIASGPLFGAFLSRVFLHERIRIETWLASVGIFAGLALVFGEAWSSASAFGDICALGTSLCATTAFVLLRRDHLDPLILAGASSFVAAALVTPFASPMSIDAVDGLLLAILGVVVLPAAYALIFLGPRTLSAPEVGLILLLETGLGPLWVWLVIGETPTPRVAAA
ncbi:MAG: DMT family transporter, partial [Proteobacteria bacterium]|nr:DMT family transporter [Pseudomonadota bacterium]